MRILTYNLLEGGRDKAMGDRTEPIITLLKAQKADVAALIEANGFEQPERLKLFEDALGMKGYLTTAATGFHVCIFVARSLTVAWHMREPGHFFHAAASLAIELPGKAIKGTT